MSEIKSNTCPYCGSPYTIADSGCRVRCAKSERVKQLITEAIEADITEAEESGLPYRFN